MSDVPDAVYVADRIVADLQAGRTVSPEEITAYQEAKRTCAKHPAWLPCPNQCGEFICTVHGKHVYECECPCIEDWQSRGLDPYVEGGKPLTEWGFTPHEAAEVLGRIEGALAKEMGPRMAAAAVGREEDEVGPCVADGQPVHNFFGLTYASYLVLPRVILQSLPVETQARLVMVLREIDDRNPEPWPPRGYHYEVQMHMTDHDEEDVAQEENRDPEHPVVSDPLRDYERGRRRVTPADIRAITERYTGRSADPQPRS